MERRVETADAPRRKRRKLTRKPKQLDAVPDLLDLSGGGGGAAAASARQHREAAGRAGGGDREFTDDEAEQDASAGDENGVDGEVVRMAHDIAVRLARRRPESAMRRRGRGRLRTVRFDGDADEIDLDRTIEALTEKAHLEADDIAVRARRSDRRSIALVVDVSGSMRGERARMAAATVGAVAGHLRSDDQLALIAFWSDAALIAPLGPPPTVDDAVRSLLSLPARGLTNVAFPLDVALEQLRRGAGDTARILLLSDCVHNAGPDPRVVAARAPRVDVLLDAVGEHDADLARELAAEGRGLCVTVRNHREVTAGLDRLLGS